MRLVFSLLCFLCFGGGAAAQSTQSSPVTMAWAELYPWFYAGEDGELTGFAADLARELAKDVAFELEAFEVESFPVWGQSQADGRSILLPAVARLPHLLDTNVFSDVVLHSEVRLAVRTEDASRIDVNDLSGLRIGVLAPGAGSDPALFPNANLVSFSNLRNAIVALLAQEIDALSADGAFVFSEARNARIDDRISFVGEPIMRIERVVALHESRAELLGPINEALARIKADGRLQDLITRHAVQLPPPSTEVLTVGVFELAPHMMVDEDGSVSGFAVDVLRDVAEIAGLNLEFKPIQMQDFTPGPGHDISPIISITDERQQLMDFAYPIEVSQFGIFTRRGDEGRVSGLADLQERRVGVFDISLGKRLAVEAGIENLFEYAEGSTLDQMVTDLAAGDIDAIIFEIQSVRDALEQAELSDAIAEVSPPVFETRRAPALRPGLGDVRERLNIVIPTYLLSEDFEKLRAQYFGTPVYWTQERVLYLVGSIISLFLSIGVIAGLLALRARTARVAELSKVRDEMETVFNTATSGIIALDKSGMIVRINSPARHMLGGITTAVPLPWPENIQFVEAETMQPLDASADPIQRARSGNKLHAETHLMRRREDSYDPRYVRVGNALLENEESGIHTVIVIDDVSNEERNRQVVERKNRLDALGQLTGGIAHDFNNLLASQLYALGLANKAQTAERREKYLETVKGSIERGRALTSRLLSFARKQPGLASAKKTSEIFNDFEKLLRPMLEESIDLCLELDNQELRQYCDQAQLETAMMNLVLNSRDAIMRAGKGSRIVVAARAVRAPDKELDKRQNIQSADTSYQINEQDSESYRYVEISVTDDGPGMDEETLSRCTDPFFTTKDSNSGTGLGLAMVYGFIRQSEGDLRIYSEINVGTTVRMTLPRGTEGGAREEPMPEVSLARGNQETILLVEDELIILSLMNDVLEDLGYQIVTASSGDTALEMVEHGEHFDLLLTDVVMPGKIGGFELARRVRKKYPEMPIIYTSGYTGFTASEMGDVQAPLLQKPCPPEELAEALRQALDAQTQSS